MSNVNIRPQRSLLYMPASNARAVAKARTLDADVIILDLEDAVAPDMKEAAREAAVMAVNEGGFGHRQLVVRTNGLDTPWGAADLVALAQTSPDAVLVPKVSNADDIVRYQTALSSASSTVALWAMIETPAAILNLADIAATASTTRLAAFVLGLNDLSKEMRAPLTNGRIAYLPIITQAVLAARANGLALFDGVWNTIDDLSGFELECLQGVAFGLDGKTLIHPNQITVCNQAFAPNAAEVAHAQAIVDAFANPANAQQGALKVEGRMVERLHLVEAERLIALNAAILKVGPQ